MAKINSLLTITGKVGFEEEISATQAAHIIAFLDGEETKSIGITDISSMSAPLGQQFVQKLAESPQDAIKKSGAKTNAEKIVALAAYVLQGGGEAVKPNDIKAQFQLAREKTPAKFNRDLGTAILSGWLSRGDDHEIYLTDKVAGIFGPNFVFAKA
ncbi:hypothetical protein [Bifidobacterium aquikefiri]